MADKMPGRAAQTASSIPGAIYHAPPTRRQGCRCCGTTPAEIEPMWQTASPRMLIPPPATRLSLSQGA
jgi:hypothetical protein